MSGYVNRFLDVDLSRMKLQDMQLPKEWLENYIGGSGLGAKILVENTDPKIDPLGPENILCFLTGPLTGTTVPGSGRHSIVAKSPLTNIWGEASVGGYWGRELKRAGYDGVIVRGQAPKPVYLWINDGKAELREAGHVWGKDTYETDALLRKETDHKAVVSCIGPSGEKMIPIAGVFTDGKEGRAAARCGLGAVQGSKNLKAIVVKGTGKVPLYNEHGLKDALKNVLPDYVNRTRMLKQFGTAGLVIGCEQTGDLPIKNWRLGKWEEGAIKISGPTMKEKMAVKSFFCAGCVIGCGRSVKMKDDRYGPVEGAGPEYETLGLIGASCLIDDLEAIVKANELCNRYGIDSIEVGNAVALAMECYEKGLINEKDTGLKLEWGNAAAMLELVKQIGEARGFGAVLGKGLVAATEEIGGASRDYAMHVKGLAFPAHDPRAFTSQALGYATSSRGACHLQSFSHAFERNLTMPELGIDSPLDRFSSAGKGSFVAKLQDLMALYDSLCLCKFSLFGGVQPSHLAQWFELVTGWELTPSKLMLAGERIFNLKRIYSIRAGAAGQQDTLPKRILSEPRGEGGAATSLPDLETMLKDYYQYRDWDEHGVPTRRLLEKLSIN